MPELTEDEYDSLYDFITHHKYPTGSSKKQRRVIRQKCKEHLTVQDGILMCSTLGSSKVPSLEKEGNFTGGEDREGEEADH